MSESLRDWLERCLEAINPLVDGTLAITYRQGYQTGVTHALLAVCAVAIVVLLIKK